MKPDGGTQSRTEGHMQQGENLFSRFSRAAGETPPPAPAGALRTPATPAKPARPASPTGHEPNCRKSLHFG